MNHVKILGARSMLLAGFAMVHAFLPFSRENSSIVAWGILALLLAVLFALSARVTPGPHRVFVAICAAGAGLVGVFAIGGGLLVGPKLLAWTLVVFGVVTGISEMAAGLRSRVIPRNDHLLLGGASLMLGLASLVMPTDSTWLSGVLVAWAGVSAVLSGTASIQWKDDIGKAGAEETVS